MRIIYLLLILLMISCSGEKKKNNNETPQIKSSKHQTIDSEQESDSVKLLDDGLTGNLMGDWITTILSDSIPKKREVFKWANFFLGNLMISVKDNNTLIISGGRYIDTLKYEVVDSKTIMLPKWDSVKIVYSPEKKLIYLGGESSDNIYKKLTIKDFDKVVYDEDLLMNYVVNLLFNCSFIPKDFASKIKYIALDLETYSMFTFDAIGIENQTGEIEYFGWKFNGDTLNLYKTSSIYDDDSGFTSYKIEEIEKQYFKNN